MSISSRKIRRKVTILILIDGFLQYMGANKKYEKRLFCHNPYFNRWFSAIMKTAQKTMDYLVTILILIDGFLQSVINDDKKALLGLSQSLF